jgi:hypothetical protein
VVRTRHAVSLQGGGHIRSPPHNPDLSAYIDFFS